MASFVATITARTLLERLRGERSTDQMRTLELYLIERYGFQEIADKIGYALAV
jgi:predicted DNA-binding protein YlxM (UPF0122 family)